MIHQEAIIQLLLEIAISPNIALCVEAGFCQIQSQIVWIIINWQAGYIYFYQVYKPWLLQLDEIIIASH